MYVEPRDPVFTFPEGVWVALILIGVLAAVMLRNHE